VTERTVKKEGAPPRILHPTDFSPASEVAFAHALKIALGSKAELEMIHVAPRPARAEKNVHWTDFPAVRATLARWGILPVAATRDEVAKIGIRVKKLVERGSNPVGAILDYCGDYPPDLIVLATHQRDGLARWTHKSVAEPLVRRSGVMTLFVPRSGKGFVSLLTGEICLRKVLIPVNHDPNGQVALDEAYFLASGLGVEEARFDLLHVGDTGKFPTLHLPQHPGWTWEEVILEGDPLTRILEREAEWAPDLVVLATRGRLDFLDALRGSTTARVVRGAHCPVLAVPVPR
jgi:nucleotide-binding universal stress UspA family protein